MWQGWARAAVLGVLGVWGAAAADEVLVFRIAVGFADRASRLYEGAILVAGGELAGLEGWRFSQNDVARPNGKFEFRTKSVDHLAENTRPQGVFPQGLTLRIKGNDSTRISFKTRAGSFQFTPAEVTADRAMAFMDGNARVNRLTE
ncbi:MAG: hypothetical protein IT158_00800 [Bryobacterales bacterium]|nr:hypothetical protein [Bryobacterales bacterium]